MANEAFVNSVVQEIIEPGLQRLMENRFFSELREGKLSIRRLQGWALQQYLRNIALLKGFALCIVKYAHDPQLYEYFLYQLNEEQDHPELTKRFGFAIGLTEEDFQNTTQIFECLAHTSATIRGMLLGSLPEGRTSALVNETMICRHSEEFKALCIVKYAHDPQLYEYFLYQLNEEQDHPELTKRFGFAIGLTEEDFQNTTQIFECLAHTSATIRGMLLGSLPEGRTSALVNETMICRHSEEFNTYLRKHYGLGDEACEFFTAHTVADQDHTRRAVEILTRVTNSQRDQQLVRETAHHTVRFKLGKFDGIYKAYS